MGHLEKRIEPLPAMVFDAVRLGGFDRLIAPPYDLIGPALQKDLYVRSPYNIIRLELNRDPDPYTSAATTLAAWHADGILKPTPHTAINHYTQRFKYMGRELSRVGLVARVRLEDFSSGRILPHERTFPKAKEDRLRLLEATRMNISSIFGLYPSGNRALERLLKEVATRAPALSATEDSGIVDEVRAIESREEIRIVQEALADARILIADGHHRYETAIEYRRRRRAAENPMETQPYDYVMMTLVAFDDPGLVILPTHRLVRRLLDEAIAAFNTRSREYFQIEEFADDPLLLAALETRGRGALGVALWGDSHRRLLTLKDPSVLDTLAPDIPRAVRTLDVSVLHNLILDRIFGMKPEEVQRGGNIEYTIDADHALEEVAGGRAAGAFLMSPPTVAAIEQVCASGATMPEKSTYFFPKLVTGLLMNPLQ